MIYFCVEMPKLEQVDYQSCRWALLDEHARLINSGRDTLDQLHLQFDAQHEVRVIVLAPGDSVLISNVEVETHHLRHLKTALPYMVEEQLADDIEDVHLATPPHMGIGTQQVAVIAHSELIDWLDILYGVQLKPGVIAPEYLFLPDTHADIRVMIDGDRALIQDGAYSGQTVERDNLAFYLQLLLQQQPEQRDIVLIASDSDVEAKAAAEALRQSMAKALPEHNIQVQLYMESAFEMLAKTAVLSRDYSLNLLQGGYQSREAALGQRAPWRAVIALLAGFTVLELLLYLGSGVWFDQRADAAKQGAVALYRELFPNERRVPNPKRQFQAHLNSEQAVGYSREFLRMLQVVAEQLPAESLRMKNLRFQAGEGLMLELEGSAIDELDNYKEMLADQNLAVELLSAVEENDGVVGRLRVEGR